MRFVTPPPPPKSMPVRNAAAMCPDRDVRLRERPAQDRLRLTPRPGHDSICRQEFCSGHTLSSQTPAQSQKMAGSMIRCLTALCRAGRAILLVTQIYATAAIADDDGRKTPARRSECLTKQHYRRTAPMCA